MLGNAHIQSFKKPLDLLPQCLVALRTTAPIGDPAVFGDDDRKRSADEGIRVGDLHAVVEPDGKS